MSSWEATDLMFRQVNPKHWDGEHPNSVAFFPTPKDEDLLSVDDARLATAELSFQHFTKNLGLNSAGTWAVAIEEIHAAEGLSIHASPVEDREHPERDNAAHCHIDFSKVSTKGQKKKRAQWLALKASARGCQYRPAEA
jgi:hypothetical protein